MKMPKNTEKTCEKHNFNSILVIFFLNQLIAVVFFAAISSEIDFFAIFPIFSIKSVALSETDLSQLNMKRFRCQNLKMCYLNQEI